MSGFFISYSRRDAGVARELHRRLEAAGYADPFLDQHPDDGIPLSEAWRDKLEEELRDTAGVIFLSSEDSRSSKWCREEIQSAIGHGHRIHEFVIDGADEGLDLLAHLQWAPLEPDDDDSWAAALARIERDHDPLGYHLLKAAQEWDGGGRQRYALLRGDELHDALAWRASARSSPDVVAELVEGSRAAAAQELGQRIHSELVAPDNVVDRELAVLLALAGLVAYGQDEPLVTTLRAAVAAVWEHGLRVIEGNARAVAFSPDLVRLAIGEHSDAVRLVDLASGDTVWRAEPERGAGEYGPGVKALAFSADGALLASAHDAFIAIWEVESGREVRREEAVAAPAITFDGGRVVAADESREPSTSWWGDAIVRDASGSVEAGIEHGSTIVRPVRPRRPGWLRCARSDTTIVRIAWSLDGSRVGGVDRAGAVHVWDAATGAHAGTWELDGARAEALALTSDGAQVIAGTSRGDVVRWPLAGGDPETVWSADTAGLARVELVGDAVLVSLEYGGVVFVASDGGGGLHSYPDAEAAAAVPGAGRYAIFAGGSLSLHDAGGAELHAVAVPVHHAAALAVAPDGDLAALATAEATIEVVDLTDGERPYRAEIEGNEATLQWWPGRRELLVWTVDGLGNGWATLWDVGSGLAVGRWEPPNGRASAAAVSPAGDTLALASEDGLDLEPVDVAAAAIAAEASSLTIRQLSDEERRAYRLPVTGSLST